MTTKIKARVILPTKINTAISRFEEAVREHEMRGAKHPEDRVLIEQDYEIAKLLLRNAIKDHM